MQLIKLPFFEELKQADGILLAGAGGGFDIFCGLSLYFALKDLGKKVYLANLSFSRLPVSEKRRSPSLLKVTADTLLSNNYFPEKYLSQWFRQQGEEVPVYCFERTGCQSLLRSYQTLITELSIDTIILIDGGIDSLLRGNEIGLGTPHEDVTSIAAVDELEIERKFLVCLGFGTERGICHAHFLENVADLIKKGGFLGTFSLLEPMTEVQKYRNACEYVFQQMPEKISIISSSVLSALAGNYRDYHATARTKGSKLWINPLMSLYWCFQFSKVAREIIYLDLIKQTETFTDVLFLMEGVQSRLYELRRWENMPI